MPMKIRPLSKPPVQKLSPAATSFLGSLAAELDPALLLEGAGFDPPEQWQRSVMCSVAKRLAVLCPRQTGKSTTAAALALNYALHKPNIIVLIVSPSKRQSDLLFAKVIDIFDAAQSRPAAGRKLAGRLELQNGSRIISLPGNEKTIRGLSADLIVIDEAAQVPDELFNTVVPMVAARGGRIVTLSTPFGQRGFFYKACTEVKLGWKVVTIGAAESLRLSAEALVEVRQTLDPHWYRQEYECEFLGDSTLYFPPELIAAAFDENIDPFYR
jgi:hypothetical protein